VLHRLALVPGAILLACKRDRTARQPAAQPDLATAEQAIETLRTAPRSKILGKIAALMDNGLGPEDLAFALVAALAEIDGDVHGSLALHALLAIEREMLPGKRVLALLRACDHVVQQRDAWKPMPSRAAVPSNLLGLSRKELVKRTRAAFDRLQGPAVRMGVRALHGRWGQEVVSAELLRMAARDDGNSGHGTHNVVAALDLLRVVKWRGADAVLDQAAGRLQPPGSWQAPPSVAARAAFTRHQKLVVEAGESWQGGVRQLQASRDLRTAARTERGDDLVAYVTTALQKNVHADALWDGLAVAAADLALRDATPSGPGVHALLLVAALRQSAARAPTPQSRLIALLSAAWRLPGFRASTLSAAVTPTASPRGDGERRLMADDRLRRAAAIRSAAGAGGAPSLAVRDGMRELLLRKDAPDPHRLELPVAATRLAAVCAPPLQGDILAAVAACGPKAADPDWPRLDEAERLVNDLFGE